MQGKNLNLNAAGAKNLYITLIQEIGKLQKFNFYVMNYSFHSVLTCAEVTQ